MINVTTAAKMMGAVDGFDAAALLSQAGFNVVMIERTRYVSRAAVAEYLAEVA